MWEGSQFENLLVFKEKKQTSFHGNDDDDELFCEIVDRGKTFSLISIQDYPLLPPHRKSPTQRQQNLNLRRT